MVTAMELLDRLTIGYFWRPAAIGVTFGYALRLAEHAIWASGPKSEERSGDVIRWAFMTIPQCVTIGLSVGYGLTAAAAYFLRSDTFVDGCVYAAPALMSFLAPDLREALRRIWNK
jgi:formate hydrogenlyase subunit 3/multisubunit Na+/H+ antiporter MnhD subunit